METISGTVHKILWASLEKDNNYKVFVLKKTNGRCETVTGEFSDIVEGVSIEVHGDYKDHPKYGKGFRAKAHSFTYDKKSNVSIALYLQSIAKFVGPIKSQDIANYFGEELEAIIEKQPERLCEVPNVGKVIAENIVKAWNDHREEKGVRIFLYSLGLSELKIKKIMLSFGLDAETKIRENPYLLCFVDFGFSTCDFIAGKLGVAPDSPLRYTHFILWDLKESMNSGHLYLYDYQLLRDINSYNLNTTFKFKNAEITLENLSPHMECLEKEGYLIKDGEKYYELNSFFYENESARILSLIAQKPDQCGLSSLDAEKFIEEYEKEQQDPTKTELFKLSEDQKDAVRSFIKEKILIITGGPGTGKTTIIKAFVKLMKNNNINFELLAPTGIASKRLGLKAECEAYTIHRKLGYKGNSWGYGINNKYDTKAVICDETSMVDQEVLYRLVSAFYTHTKLVFVGDNDQLPSVGPGRVLNELIKSECIKTIFLKNIFRQEKQSDIIKEAKKIREGDTDLSLFKGDNKADIWFLRSSQIKNIEQIIMRFAKELKDSIKEKGIQKTFQIITPRNNGPLSVETLNEVLQQSLNPKVEGEREITLNNYTIRKGDRVLIKKNNYQLEVFNGDIGKVKRIMSTEIEVEIDDYEGKRSVYIPIESAEELLKLAYSITVHKCLPKDSEIFTKNGIKPIERIKIGDYVLSKNNKFNRVVWSGETPKNNKVIIKTRTGVILESSPNHEIYIADEKGLKFIKASKIKKNSFACCSKQGIPGKSVILHTKNKMTNKFTTQIKLPRYLNKDISWMIGALIGDGCYTDKNDGIVEYTSPQDTELLTEMENILKNIGVPSNDHKKNKKTYSKYFCSKNFRKWMFSIGMDYIKSDLKTTPNIIFSSKEKNRCAFIAGLFDTDGSVNKAGVIRFTTASLKLAKEIQLLLLSIGVVSFLSSQGPKHHKVLVSGIDTIRFKDKIPMRCLRKKKILCNYKISKTQKSNHYEIPFGKNFVNLFIEAFYKKEGKSRGILGKGLFSKYPVFCSCLNNIKNKKYKIRLNHLLKMTEIAKKEHFKLPIEIKKEIKSNTYYDKIESVKYTKNREKMWDLEVDGDPSYALKGYFVHNSQGGEYDLVILPVVKLHGKRILQKNLLYTAITRARKRVIIIGQASAIVDAIENDKIQERNTNLGERLNKWMKNEGISLHQLYSNPSNYQNVKILNQLLSYEEKASVELDSTTSSYQKEQKKKEQQDQKKQSKHPLFLKPSLNQSLDDLLAEIDTLETTTLKKDELSKKDELPF